MGANAFMRTASAGAVVAVLSAAACAPRVVHRDYLPTDSRNTVRTPGEPNAPGQRHVIPAHAVDGRSAVLVYSTGGHLEGDRARIQIVFRARNDEPRPIALQPSDTLLVFDARGKKPRVVEPARVDPGPGARLDANDEVILEPRSSAQWAVEFELPKGPNPLYEARSFLVSWTYRVDEEAHEERTSFVSRRPRSDGWILPERRHRPRSRTP